MAPVAGRLLPTVTAPTCFMHGLRMSCRTLEDKLSFRTHGDLGFYVAAGAGDDRRKGGGIGLSL